MPQENRKEEFIRTNDPITGQMRCDTFKSPYRQDFAEIYIEDCNYQENSESLSQKITEPSADEKGEIFLEMRRLGHRIGYPGGPYGRVQTKMFYEQAKFMENFEDDYEGNATFSMYFPDYHSMGYEQLRTYFSWRSKVRAGDVRKTSFSYVFVYIYELINNIGVRNCEDGLDKLIFIWDEYRRHESKLDRYMSEWVKDYYMTNDFGVSFEDLLLEKEVMRKLYQRSGPESLFDFYYRYSDYKIKQSAFYTPETAVVISAYFDHVVGAINRHMSEQSAAFDDVVFDGKDNAWKPFSKALYCLSTQEARKKVIYFSKYRCENGFWTSSENKVCKKGGRLVIGYILKRIEQFLRKSSGFKYKLNADKTRVPVTETVRLIPDPDSFFRLIDSAILDYYKQSQRKTITVDTDRLETIRTNALTIQKKLLVNAEGAAEEDNAGWPAGVEEEEITPRADAEEEEEEFVGRATSESENAGTARRAATEPANPPPAVSTDNIWLTFSRSLDEAEKTAVRMILRNVSIFELHEFLKSKRMMLEVMVDNVNQKAIEAIGDNIFELSDKIVVFEDYKAELERVMSNECK